MATFTENVRRCIDQPAAGWRAEVVRVVDEDGIALQREVAANWNSRDADALRPTLDVLAGYDAVVLQHEFGLFGGPDGESALDLVDGLRSPLITVLHTALTDPSSNQRRIIDTLADRSDQLVVLTEAARDRLVCVHRLPASRVSVIPHGATANVAGQVRRTSASPTVLTWGLLGRGKGIEHGIRAVAHLADRGLDVTYVVAGATHPKVRERDGDRYRDGLIELAADLGVADRVQFDDAYRDWDSLRDLVRGVDAVLLPYDSRDQVTSGVLVDALASAKPLVSTRFPHAVEALGGGSGLLVGHEDDEAMADALEQVLLDPGTARRLSSAAFEAAQPLLWPSVGDAYRAVLGSVARARIVA
ncbi:MAG: glycosyltransferase [Acidimicrobiales bacterium]|nr:glycosyltransferase [Acidimicrobiales bacterium]